MNAPVPKKPSRSYNTVLAALCFALGVYIAPRINISLWLIAPPLLLIGMIPLFRRLQIRLLPLLCCLCFTLGLGRACLSLSDTDAQTGKKLAVEGVIAGEVTQRSDGRVTFMLKNGSVEGKLAQTLIYCTIYPNKIDALPTLYDGMRVAVTGTVYKPDERRGEHDFDFRMWMATQGAKLGVTCSGLPTILGEQGVGDIFYRMRQQMAAAFECVMGENAKLPIALVLGQRDSMSDQELEQFRQLGIAHVMSVSGLHVGLLGAALLWLLRKLRVKPALRFAIMLAFMLFYSLLTGFSAATQRACVMLMMALIAGLCQRRPDPIVTLSQSMLVVLLIDPLQLFSAGFALSYCATAAILMLTAPMSRLVPIRRTKSIGSRLLYTLRDALCVSIAASIGVLIPTANTFHKLPTYGILLNVLFVPLLSLMLPVYSLVLVLLPIPCLGEALGFIASQPTRLLMSMIELMSQLPYASLRVPTLPAITTAAVCLGVIILSDYVCASARRKSLCMLLCAVIALSGAAFAKPASLRYIQLSCGQADAALLMTDKTTYAFDVSEDGGEVAGYLLAENRDLDALFLTHLHLDHAGGVQRLLDEGIRIGRVYLPQDADKVKLSEESLQILTLLKERQIPVLTLAAGDEIAYDRGTVTVLWPEKDKLHYGKDGNESAMALLIKMDGFTLMNCSDVTSDYEGYYVKGCDILKVAHHGSMDSTSLRFLEAAAPQLALISCSSTNPSLPAKETLDRLTQLGIPYYRTDVTGDMTLTINGDSMIVQSYRERSKP